MTVLPNLIYLDTSVLQYMVKYAGEISNGLDPFENEDLQKIPQGCEQINALRKMEFISRRANLPLIFNKQVMEEIFNPKDSYILEMLNWCWEENGSFITPQKNKDIPIENLGYLSKKDMSLVKEAVELGCDGLLTMDYKLQKNYNALQKSLGLEVMTPLIYWEKLQPYAALF